MVRDAAAFCDVPFSFFSLRKIDVCFRPGLLSCRESGARRTTQCLEEHLSEQRLQKGNICPSLQAGRGGEAGSHSCLSMSCEVPTWPLAVLARPHTLLNSRKQALGQGRRFSLCGVSPVYVLCSASTAGCILPCFNFPWQRTNGTRVCWAQQCHLEKAPPQCLGR